MSFDNFCSSCKNLSSSWHLISQESVVLRFDLLQVNGTLSDGGIRQQEPNTKYMLPDILPYCLRTSFLEIMAWRLERTKTTTFEFPFIVFLTSILIDPCCTVVNKTDATCDLFWFKCVLSEVVELFDFLMLIDLRNVLAG